MASFFACFVKPCPCVLARVWLFKAGGLAPLPFPRGAPLPAGPPCLPGDPVPRPRPLPRPLLEEEEEEEEEEEDKGGAVQSFSGYQLQLDTKRV